MWDRWVDTGKTDTFKITIIDVVFDVATETFRHDDKQKGWQGITLSNSSRRGKGLGRGPINENGEESSGSEF